MKSLSKSKTKKQSEQSAMIRRRSVLAGGAGLGLLGLSAGAAVFLARSTGQAGSDATGPSLQEVMFDPVQPVLGNPAGDVTIVEFFDYQCPFCKRGHDDLIAAVAADGDIRLVMKDWPIFGGASVLASQLVLGAVGSDGYKQAHSSIMATPARLSHDEVRETLQESGFDPATLDQAYRADRAVWDGLLQRNSQQAAALGLQGTPAFIVGQSVYRGAMDAHQLRRAVAVARRDN